MVSPDKVETTFKTLKTRPPPSEIAEGNYGHALGILSTLIENKSLPESPQKQSRIERLKNRLREKVTKGILPAETIDLLGWDEEPQDWRE